MNYLLELKAFYDRLETTPLSAPAISLWHALMHMANKTGWKGDFCVPRSVLQLKTSLSVRTIERARIELEKQGLIRWKSQSGNLAAIYQLYSLCISYPQSDAQIDAQAVAITKQNKNIQNNIKQTSAQNKNQAKPSSGYDIDEIDRFWDTVPKL